MMGEFDAGIGAPRINLAETADFDLGGLRVSPAHREVRMNGERRELEPRVAQVLVALALARSNVVSRDQLIEQCWDGRIVGDDAINRCIVALRHLAKEFSPEPFAIETVTRVGYSLIERPADGSAVASGGGRARTKVAIAALLVLVLVAGVLAVSWSRFGREEAAPASIAVTSFRDLSAGDSYFAEGVGEEILSQLAREPQFRVVGRASSSQFGEGADISEVARRLDVDYVLEGSVRTQGDRVRVNAGLVRASDGIRLWSDSYDGKLDDIFAIQQRIGGDIAGALRRKLVRSPAISGPLVTSGEAYNLYLTARGLIRTRGRFVAGTASNLLRDAINLDPNYAPAWAALAESTYYEPTDTEGLIAVLSRSESYARHAIKLAPDLAQAHSILGIILPQGSAEAQSHLRRAAELDPNNAENLIALGSALAAEGEFDAEMAAYRRAGELDPVWFRTTGQQGIRLSEMGRRAEAEAIANRGFANNKPNLHILLGRIAWIVGDFSEAARHWSITARANSPRWSFRAKEGVAEVKVAVGLTPSPDGFKAAFSSVRSRAPAKVDVPPTPAVWRMHNRNVIAADVYQDDSHVGAKLMLNAGRARELVATYDGPVGLLSLRPNQRLRVDQLHEAAVVALALRQAGRSADADRLLGKANSSSGAVYRQQTIPFALDADVAAIWAVQGRRDQALSMLERAMRRGWTHNETTDLPDIADEPAFKSLRGQIRFNRIRASLAAHLARERAETVQLRI